MSDNEIYLLIKYIKSVLWRVAKRLSYIEDARCLKVKLICVNLRHGRLAQWRSLPCYRPVKYPTVKLYAGAFKNSAFTMS